MTAPTRSADKDFVIHQAKELGVRFIRLWFTDILGFLKSFAISAEELETAMYDGHLFDGSAIEGFARIEESDMFAHPDPTTFCVLPWRPKSGGAVARMFCDIHLPDGTPYTGDPRYVLQKMLKEAAAKGFTYYVGGEFEHYYFRSSDPPLETLDRGGYFDLTPLDVASDLRRETVLNLEAMGIGVEYSHHEVGPSQHEIDLRYGDALTMADNAMTYRLVVKEVAMHHNVYATFMPKPLGDSNGNGMHTHLSLFRGNENAFFDPKKKDGLSDLCLAFIAGLLRHAPELTLVFNQWANSYKRLVPGFEAPLYLSWAHKNRSDLIRIPTLRRGHESDTRIEFRSPDPACNPYLTFACMLAAGLEGVEKGYPPVPPVEENVFELSPEERAKRGIGTLPSDLNEAIKLAEESELLKRVFGEALHRKFIENKKLEWERYRAHVSDYELNTYLPIL
ncbi:MAG: glutamine synthetase family protein [bacterium]|nr:glutamine synthetase family protein [bacterium]